MTDKPFRWDLPFTTRDGRKAERIYSGARNVTNPDETEIVLVTDLDGNQDTFRYDVSGSSSEVTIDEDLVNLPTKRTVYLVCSQDSGTRHAGNWFAEKQDAFDCARDLEGKRLGQKYNILPVEIEEP